MFRIILATLSKDEPGQVEGIRVLPFTLNVCKVNHIHFSLVDNKVPQLILHLGRVPDTLLVLSQVLALLNHPTIGNCKNLRRYWVAIHPSIVQAHHGNCQYLLKPFQYCLPAIYIPSLLLSHHANCVVQHVSSVLLAWSQSPGGQQEVISLLYPIEQFSTSKNPFWPTHNHPMPSDLHHPMCHIHLRFFIFTLGGLLQTSRSGIKCLCTMHFNYTIIFWNMRSTCIL